MDPFLRQRNLSKLAIYLSSKVPYYQRLGLAAFTELPIITKAKLMSEPESFISDDYLTYRRHIAELMHDKGYNSADELSNYQISTPPDTIIEQTTGTTGLPGRFPKTKLERARVALPIWGARRRFDPDVTTANFLPFVHLPFNYPKDQRLYSTSGEDLLDVYKSASEKKMRWLHVQPTLILRHIHLLKNLGIHGMQGLFTVIETTGELLLVEERRAIQDYFGCRLVNQYGCAETWAVGYDYVGSGNFSIISDNTYVELVHSETGELVTDIGVPGDVLLTSFALRLFPIVRYFCGDRGEWVDGAGERQLRLHEDRSQNLLFVDGAFISGPRVMRILMNRAFARSGYIYFAFIQFVQTSERDIEVRMSQSEKSELFFEKLIEVWPTFPYKQRFYFHLVTISVPDDENASQKKRSLFLSALPRHFAAAPTR